MSKTFRKDLTGRRFGRLTVLEFVPNDKPGSYWKCRCDCGNVTTVHMSDLQGGRTKSCGCLQKEIATRAKKTHGQRHARLYEIWRDMRKRCYNPHNQIYRHYGGRGIAVCDEWKHDFQKFYGWAMASGYRDDLTIDRIDNDKGYSPDNCRWADKKTQTRNRRNTIFVEYRGQKMTLAEAAEQSGIAYTTLRERYYRGERGERLFRSVDTKYRSKK